MSALCRYQLADLLRSQRWVAPLLVYTAFLAAVYSSDAGPAVPAYGATAGALVPVVAWLTRGVLSVEDDAARHVTAAAAGGLLRVQVALLASAIAAALPLVGLAVLWAAVANADQMHGWRPRVGGLAIHLVFALLGVGLGALVSRPLIRAPGAAALAVVAAVVIGLVLRWSPVFSLLRVLQANPRHGFTAAVSPSAAGVVGLAAVGCAVSLAATRRS